LTALSLPFEPQTAPPAPRFWRLVRATATGAYAHLKRTLPARERAVYLGLAAYQNRYQHWPTSRELLAFLLELKHRHPRHPRYRLIVDVNSVSPRLSGMSTHGRAVVLRGPVRRCAVKGTQQLTWMIPMAGGRR
jgi:hypothetical protein